MSTIIIYAVAAPARAAIVMRHLASHDVETEGRGDSRQQSERNTKNQFGFLARSLSLSRASHAFSKLPEPRVFLTRARAGGDQTRFATRSTPTDRPTDRPLLPLA